jgi:hypothetical protein
MNEPNGLQEAWDAVSFWSNDFLVNVNTEVSLRVNVRLLES